MQRLIKDWKYQNITIFKGVCIKEIPKDGVLSKIPTEYLEEYKPAVFTKKKQKKQSPSEPEEKKTPEESARISAKKI